MVRKIHRALVAHLVFVAVVALLGASGCPAVYPELATRLRSPAPQQALKPPPPDDLRWIRFIGAQVPERTRDGRTWDQSGDGLPDPYAILFVNGKETIRTRVQANALEPTWPGSPSGNFRIGPDDRLRVELWNSNALNDQPIGVRDVGPVSSDQRASGEIRVELEGGGKIALAFEPAHARIGLGLWYELRTGAVFISRTMQRGPAERAGLRKGDEVLKIDDRDTHAMSPGEVKSAFNSIPVGGLVLMVRHADGPTETVKVAEGPIYPTFEQFGAID